jgi:methylmalonyl-CoA mutase cobalamin-binding subunit
MRTKSWSGTIPVQKIQEVKRLGVAEAFTPGSSVAIVVDFNNDASSRLGMVTELTAARTVT